jgi:hypothetical protein
LLPKLFMAPDLRHGLGGSEEPFLGEVGVERSSTGRRSRTSVSGVDPVIDLRGQP